MQIRIIVEQSMATAVSGGSEAVIIGGQLVLVGIFDGRHMHAYNLSVDSNLTFAM